MIDLYINFKVLGFIVGLIIGSIVLIYTLHDVYKDYTYHKQLKKIRQSKENKQYE